MLNFPNFRANDYWICISLGESQSYGFPRRVQRDHFDFGNKPLSFRYPTELFVDQKLKIRLPITKCQIKVMRLEALQVRRPTSHLWNTEPASGLLLRSRVATKPAPAGSNRLQPARPKPMPSLSMGTTAFPHEICSSLWYFSLRAASSAFFRKYPPTIGSLSPYIQLAFIPGSLKRPTRIKGIRAEVFIHSNQTPILTVRKQLWGRGP